MSMIPLPNQFHDNLGRMSGMWTCKDCGFNDPSGELFEEEHDSVHEETVRFCPECGSAEVVYSHGDHWAPDDGHPEEETGDW